MTVEATECGDVLELGGVPYRFGRESRAQTGEPHAPDAPDLGGPGPRWWRPSGVRRRRAPPCRCPRASTSPASTAPPASCARSRPRATGTTSSTTGTASSATAAAGRAFMLNWPFHSNDYPAGLFGAEERARTSRGQAPDAGLRPLHPEPARPPRVGLATGVYPTEDHLPLLPYVRESRRVVPVRWLGGAGRRCPGRQRERGAPDGVAVGDYYLDHHHDKDHRPPGSASGSSTRTTRRSRISFGAMVPEAVDGLIAAEKCIGATHIVNGCSRLQPVAVAIGQAAGEAAAGGAGGRARTTSTWPRSSGPWCGGLRDRPGPRGAARTRASRPRQLERVGL